MPRSEAGSGDFGSGAGTAKGGSSSLAEAEKRQSKGERMFAWVEDFRQPAVRYGYGQDVF